jgi:hypothetical protein
MKKSLHPLIAAAALVAAFTVSPAFAGGGHGPKYGGVVRELHNMSYESVAKPDSLTLLSAITTSRSRPRAPRPPATTACLPRAASRSAPGRCARHADHNPAREDLSEGQLQPEMSTMRQENFS